jgi:hypothetical protein
MSDIIISLVWPEMCLADDVQQLPEVEVSDRKVLETGSNDAYIAEGRSWSCKELHNDYEIGIVYT